MVASIVMRIIAFSISASIATVSAAAVSAAATTPPSSILGVAIAI